MHEVGIANSILEAVRNEMLPYPDAKPVKVTVKIGAMAGGRSQFALLLLRSDHSRHAL